MNGMLIVNGVVTLSVSRRIHLPTFRDDFILSLISRQNTTKYTGKIRCREDRLKFSLTGGRTKYIENTSKIQRRIQRKIHS
jgi:hypothetical protein